MSQRFLLNAVRDHLRLPEGAGAVADGLGLTESQCEAMLSGEPSPMCGELFVAVHEGEWTNEYEEDGRGDTVGVYVTVTRRVTFAPKDRVRVPLLDAADAIDLWCEKIAAKVHGNLSIMAAANATLGASVNGFIRPLYFKGAQGPSQERGPDWFTAAADSEVNTPVGVSRTLTFVSRETRWQTMASQT